MPIAVGGVIVFVAAAIALAACVTWDYVEAFGCAAVLFAQDKDNKLFKAWWS